MYIAASTDIPEPGYIRPSPMEINGEVNHSYEIKGYVNISYFKSMKSPDHVPEPIQQAFNEGSKAYSIGCWNAAGCMLRASIDLATQRVLKLKQADIPLDDKQWLKKRLKWMFDNNHLNSDMRELSTCIREDGNDAAHSVNLSKADALDILDFSHTLLECLFTRPARLKEAGKRRDKRRAENSVKPRP